MFNEYIFLLSFSLSSRLVHAVIDLHLNGNGAVLYLTDETKRNWSIVSSYCLDLGGEMVTVPNILMNSFVKNIIAWESWIAVTGVWNRTQRVWHSNESHGPVNFLY